MADQTYVITPPFGNAGYDIYQPGSRFLDWITVQPNCPIESYAAEKDSSGAALDNGLQTVVTNIGGGTRMVQTIMAKKFLKGVYPFYVRVIARGTAYLVSPLMTLNVVCGPASTVITESSYNAYQD